MADVSERPQAATFDWHDAMPSDADNMELLLAKYARLQFVHQVQSCRDQSTKGLYTVSQSYSFLIKLERIVVLRSYRCAINGDDGPTVCRIQLPQFPRHMPIKGCQPAVLLHQYLSPPAAANSMVTLLPRYSQPNSCPRSVSLPRLLSPLEKSVRRAQPSTTAERHIIPCSQHQELICCLLQILLMQD